MVPSLPPVGASRADEEYGGKICKILGFKNIIRIESSLKSSHNISKTNAIFEFIFNSDYFVKIAII